MTESGASPEAVLLGQAYEILAKRGGIAYLLEQKLLDPEDPSLRPWKKLKVNDVTRALYKAMEITDPELQAVVSTTIEHMALTAFGHGYTVMRACLESLDSAFRRATGRRVVTKRLRAIYCPLLLPGSPSLDARDRVEELYRAFGIDGLRDPAWTSKGQCANADFALWIEGDHVAFLLVEEYSYEARGDWADFRHQGTHLNELLAYRRLLESRSVFARVTAEVEEAQFDLSDDIRHYLTALTHKDKPLYKLCQAASYVASLHDLLRRNRLLPEGPVLLRAIAMTPSGVESLGASNSPADPRHTLLLKLAQAYRDTATDPEDDPDTLKRRIEKAFNGMLRKLPKALRDGMSSLKNPSLGEDYAFAFEERTSDFTNPNDTFTLDEATALIPLGDGIESYFGGDARAVIRAEMAARLTPAGRLSLRDIHAAAVVAGLKNAKRGQLNLIALEGNPGIGKTTAVREYLATTDSGYLMLYLSPRVVINRDVTSSFARSPHSGEATGILTLTTYSDLISAAPEWYRQQTRQAATRRIVEGAVVADGVPDLKRPNGSILVISPEEEAEIESRFHANRLGVRQISEYEAKAYDQRHVGVLKTLATTARELLALNPDLRRVVLTAAIQGFKKAQNRTTISALSHLFRNSGETHQGVAERRAWAKAIPNIIVMVDELAGDGAGAPLVHAIAQWLREQFLDPFEGESPFTVILIAADASLGNEIVFERYLNDGAETPEKVLVAKSRGRKPFDWVANEINVGGRKVPALHVMTNSFPAKALTLHYTVRLKNLRVGQESEGSKTVRQLIRQELEPVLLESACQEIERALKQGANQIIYFAQNKPFLRELRKTLIERNREALKEEEVQCLDSSVPAHQRKRLVEPAQRDRVKIFLMTSSGARGVSFPKADWIIAAMPRFGIEAQLMEIAQLIYRGRGKTRDESGQLFDGDTLSRHLVFTIDDLVVNQGEIDERQWLRNSLNLLTLLVMLRATVFTRITGDACLNHPLALVPVGAIGVEETINQMSNQVREFVNEAESVSRDSSGGMRSLLRSAITHAKKIFASVDLQGVAQSDKEARSYAQPEFVRALHSAVASGIAPLIPLPDASSPILPKHLHFVGPLVLEQWSDFTKTESLLIEQHDKQLAQAIEEFKKQLWVIKKHDATPKSLRNPTAELLRLLQETKHNDANDFRVIKSLSSANTWVAFPADYLTFLSQPQRDDGQQFVLKHEELWMSALCALFGVGAMPLPPLPNYKSFPWAAAVCPTTPLSLNLVFNDRYFMVSNELNLLNTLLLSREEEQ